MIIQSNVDVQTQLYGFYNCIYNLFLTYLLNDDLNNKFVDLFQMEWKKINPEFFAIRVLCMYT